MRKLRKLRPGLHYAPVQSGVYFGSARGQFVLRGPQALFGVADVCVPALEDGATEDDLVAALGTDRARPVVQLLLKTFEGHGLLLDPARFTAQPPSADERRRHAGALAELETVSDDPYRHFATLRAATVVLCGPPEAVAPAARGLARAGVGRLVLAVPDPRAVAATARRLGAATYELTGAPTDGPLPLGGDADAYVLCHAVAGENTGNTGNTETTDAWAARLAQLPPGRPVVPVAFAEAFTLVGPVLDGPVASLHRTALHRRAADWAAAEPAVPVIRPVGDALAGALAGRAVFHALTTGADPGEAYIVHGDEPAADRLDAPAHPNGPDAHRHALTDVPAEPAPAAEATAEAVASLARPWTGLYSLPTAYDLPQLPVALAEARPCSGGTRAVVGRGGNQQQAALQAALAVLRATVSDAAPESLSEGASEGVAAAGTTAERWLLDGALRLLAARTGPAARRVDFDTLGAHPRGLWRVLADYEGVDPDIELYELPGLSWPLARVRTQDGAPLSAAWGPDADHAVADALADALARVRTRAARGTDLVGDGPATDALESAESSAVAALRAEVTAYAAATGLEFTGRPAGRDPVVGDLPFRHGRVSAA
ncbi:hypothetical protein [Streptomyces huasconensis]|uniref:hypothetical protein n=1 Tax=Streptomyces huasconensis TaxID=1854574 RepID=UPI0036FE08A6